MLDSVFQRNGFFFWGRVALCFTYPTLSLKKEVLTNPNRASRIQQVVSQRDIRCMERTFNREYQYYRILGLNKDASMNDIKRSYRLIIKKYHPDLNKDPSATEIAKKIIEAYGVLADPAKRLLYDSSEAECPKCWTYEVGRIQGQGWTAFSWRCRHCGCNFTYAEKKQEEEKPGIKSEQFVCPRCGRPLIFDNSVELYRCTNKACFGGKGVFSRFELRKYYSRSSEDEKANKTTEGYQNSESPSIVTKNRQRGKEVEQVVLSGTERVALGFTSGISFLLTASLLYFVLFDFSLLLLGLFIFLLGLSTLSWCIYRYPNIITKIKSLILIK